MIVALGTEANGKTGTASIEVTRDIVAPVVRINSPREGLVSPNGKVPVTGLVNDIVDGATDPAGSMGSRRRSVKRPSWCPRCRSCMA